MVIYKAKLVAKCYVLNKRELTIRIIFKTHFKTLLAFAITSWFGHSTMDVKKTLVNGQFDGGKFTIK
jgi:hypothetical protein